MTQTTCCRSLPEELIIEILSWLPVKTLLRSKSVSKSFLNLIINPEFVKLHLGRSLIRNSSVILPYLGKAILTCFDVDHPHRPLVQLDIHPDVIKLLEPFLDEILNESHIPHIIGICNGVVCFKKEHEIVLYNPATRAYRQVPRRFSNAMFRDELIAYDCVSDDFKIFSIMQHFQGRRASGCETYLYKLKDNSWSKIESPPPGFHCELSCSHFANNNFLYWITCKYDSENIILMRFDVTSHRYEEIPLPIQGIYPRVWGLRLAVLKGRLHMMTFENSFDIWMLKEDSSWTRVFSCSESIYRDKFGLSSQRKKFPCLLLYVSSKDESLIIGIEKNRQLLIICCHLESQTSSVLQVISLSPEEDYYILTAMAWAESLVPLA